MRMFDHEVRLLFLQKLIAKGANKNAKDEVSMTPLHFAAERDSIGAANVISLNNSALPCMS